MNRLKGGFMLKKTIIIFLVQFFCSPFLASAYETIEVWNGGSIEGVVEFTGTTVPKDDTLTLSSETEHCGTTVTSGKYLIKDRKIENVVVFVKDIKAGKAIPTEPIAVTNLKCVFVPRVSVGFKGNTFVAKNNDPVFHTFDIHNNTEGRYLFAIGLPDKGLSVKKYLTKTGVMEMTCYVHPWMQGYVYVFDHPYAAVTNDKGEFVIKDIPPGTYTIEAWHEALGNVELANIKVESAKTSTTELTYTQ